MSNFSSLDREQPTLSIPYEITTYGGSNITFILNVTNFLGLTN